MLVGMYAFVLSFAIRDATRPAYDPALALAIQAMLAGGAGAVASWLMERAQEQWPKVKALRADVKSYLAMVIAGRCDGMGRGSIRQRRRVHYCQQGDP